MSIALAPEVNAEPDRPAISGSAIDIGRAAAPASNSTVSISTNAWNIATGLCVFALINLAIFRLSLFIPAYAVFEEDLRRAFAIPYAALAALVGVACLRLWWPDVWASCKRFELSVALCELLALGIGMLFVVYAAIAERNVLTELGLVENFVVFAGVLLAKRFLVDRFQQELVKKGTVNFAQEVGSARLVSSDPSLSSTDLLVDIRKLKSGDRLRMKKGEFLGVDGTIESGLAELEERRVSYLAALRFKQAGDEVFAGSKVMAGEIVVRVSGPAEESSIARLEQVWNKALQAANPAEYFRRFEHYSACAVLLLTIVMAQYWATADEGFERWSENIAALLLIAALPLGLRLKPWAFRVAAANAYRFGLLLRELPVLGRLARCHTLAIDYRAGQSLNEPTVARLAILDTRVSDQGICGALAVLLSRIDEPLYQNIAQYCRARVIESPIALTVSDFSYYAGRGVAGTVQGAEFTIGDEDLLIERGVQLQSSELVNPQAGTTSLYVALADEVVARIEVNLGMRADGRRVLDRIGRYGIRTQLLSTDRSELVDQEAKEMGFELASVFAGLEASQFIERVKEMRRTLFVAQPHTPEERLNASPLAASNFDEFRWNVGESDVLFFRDDIGLLAALIARARALEQAININALVCIGVTGLALFCAILGQLPPVLMALTVLVTIAFEYLSLFRLDAALSPK